MSTYTLSQVGGGALMGAWLRVRGLGGYGEVLGERARTRRGSRGCVYERDVQHRES
jgi:hypothetical protein